MHKTMCKHRQIQKHGDTKTVHISFGQCSILFWSAHAHPFHQVWSKVCRRRKMPDSFVIYRYDDWNQGKSAAVLKEGSYFLFLLPLFLENIPVGNRGLCVIISCTGHTKDIFGVYLCPRHMTVRLASQSINLQILNALMTCIYPFL